MNLAPDFWLASEEVRKPWRNNQNILRKRICKIFSAELPFKYENKR